MITSIRTTGVVALACAALTAAACSDDDPTGIDDGEAPFRVTLSSDASAQSFAQSSKLVVGDPLLATIGLDAVESIDVSIGLVEVRQAGGGWIEAGTADFDVDLLDLPEDGLELIDVSLETGQYTGIRFFLTETPTITLSEEIEVGRTLFEAGTHELRIPSSDQSGLKLNADFEVDEDGQVIDVEFDSDASVERVTATGSGVLMISPVLHVTDEDGDDVGEFDDDDDVDAEVEFEGLVESVEANGFTMTDGTLVIVNAETEIGGDILSLAAVATALAGGETVTVEGEGNAGAAANTVVATKVEFEVDDD